MLIFLISLLLIKQIVYVYTFIFIPRLETKDIGYFMVLFLISFIILFLIKQIVFILLFLIIIFVVKTKQKSNYIEIGD